MGSSAGATIERQIASASMQSAAPIQMQAGTSARASEPTSLRATCGTINPMKPTMPASTTLLAANSVWLVLIGAGNALGMLLNGAGIVRLQIGAALGYSVLAFLLKLVLPHYLGAAGIVWATVIGYGGVVVPLYAAFTWRYLRRASVA